MNSNCMTFTLVYKRESSERNSDAEGATTPESLRHQGPHVDFLLAGLPVTGADSGE